MRGLLDVPPGLCGRSGQYWEWRGGFVRLLPPLLRLLLCFAGAFVCRVLRFVCRMVGLVELTVLF